MEKPSKAEHQVLERARGLLMALEREISVLVRRSMRALWEGPQQEGVLDRWTYALLIRLSEEGPMRVGEVARRFGFDKSTASRHLGRLQDEALVESFTDPDDGRSSLLRVTAQGEERLKQTREARLGPLRRVFASWQEEDQAVLTRLLARLNAELDERDDK